MEILIYIFIDKYELYNLTEIIITEEKVSYGKRLNELNCIEDKLIA